MNTRKSVRVTKNEHGEQLYCLDDICEDLGLKSVTVPLTDPGEAVYEVTSTDGTSKRIFVTLVSMNKILAEVNTPEAKAMQYQITRGIYACPTLTGKMLFNAEDVARCLGYTDHDKAIKKYCKSAKSGFIGASDVSRLVAHSTLSTAEKVGDWIADRGTTVNMSMLRGTPIFW